MQAMALGGTIEDGEPFWSVVCGGADQRVLAGPVAKTAREAHQISEFVLAMRGLGAMPHEVDIREGSDPPDVILGVAGQEFAVELTELTVRQLRGRMAVVRRVSRSLEASLHETIDDFPHLVGHRVVVTDRTGQARLVKGKVGGVVSDLLTALRVDRGVAGGPVDFSAGLPETIPLTGWYPDVGDFGLIVNHDEGHPNSIVVTASAQLDVTLSEARQVLVERVVEKDVATNEILLISSGLVDDKGYVNPHDAYLFSMIAEHGPGALPEVRHLKAIVMHDLITNRVLGISRLVGAPLPFAVGADDPNDAPDDLGVNEPND